MKRELKDVQLSRIARISARCHKAYPDEKGTERYSSAHAVALEPIVTRHIPMKRELKEGEDGEIETGDALVTRHIPMKRELKAAADDAIYGPVAQVTRHIPMKRELKVAIVGLAVCLGCRVTRHIPMKRELKAISLFALSYGNSLSHKAYPDEKGTESYEDLTYTVDEEIVTRHIPMKRELKETLLRPLTRRGPMSQGISR